MTQVLITGGTGSFGQAYVCHLLATDVERVVVYSRDELKQHQMRASGLTDPRVRYFIGDIRDQSRLELALKNIDVVIHAAALKQVDTCEYNPLEAVKTNIDGTANVIRAALNTPSIRKVLMLGTDKAVDPTNLYGATKLVAEKLIIDANAYTGVDGPAFASTRYGNVISSRGSVLPVFQQQHAAGQPITVTDPDMTRFVLTLDQGVGFISDSLARMQGGEVFIPKLSAVTVRTIAEAITYPDEPELSIVGTRPGEKHHELLISANESGRTLDCGTHYLVQPIVFPVDRDWAGEPLEPGVAYGSDTAPRLDAYDFGLLAGLIEDAVGELTVNPWR